MVFKFLSDFKLNNSGQFKVREHYKNMVKKINEIQDANGVDRTVKFDLEMVGFIEFLLQIAHEQYPTEEDPVEKVTKLFEHIKANNTVISGFDGLYLQQQQIYQKKMVKELNKSLKKDPHIKLPPGFSKELVEEELTETEKMCKSILCDIIQK